MSLNRAILATACALCLGLACGAFAAEGASSARDAALKAAMNKRIRVQVKEKSFEQTVRELCRAAGLKSRDLKIGSGPAPKSNRRGSPMRALGGGRFESFVRCRTGDGRRSYTVQMARALPLKQVLAVVCDFEGVAPRVVGGRLVTAGAGQVAADTPFDASEFERLRGNINVPVERDWRRAVRLILENDARSVMESQDGKAYTSANLEKSPMVKAMAMSLGALKAHDRKDAVRIWLLCRAAYGLWWYDSQGRDKRVMGQLASIIKEVDRLEAAGAGKKNLKELGEVLTKIYRSSGNVQYAHGNIGLTRTPEVLLKHCMADGYFAAAHAWETLEDRPAAARAMRKCAYYYAETYRWRYDHMWSRYFDMYHGLLDDKARLQAAREDLVTGARHFRDDKALYMAHPADWKCKECGRGREAHAADKDKLIARFTVRLARALAANGLFEEAAGKYREALELDPADGGYVGRRRTLRTGRAGIGSSTVEAEHPPRAPRIMLELADVLCQAGRAGKAIELLKSEIKKTPANPVFVGKLAGLYERAGRKPEAIAAWKQYIELLPGETRHDKGRKARAEHRIAVLEGRVKEGLKTDLSDPETRKLYEQLNSEVGKMLLERRYEAGLALLRSEALKRFPQDSGFLRREIEFLRRMGRSDEAAAKLVAFNKMHPDHAKYIARLRGQSTQPGTGGNAREYSSFMKELMALRMGRNRNNEKALKMIREGLVKFPERGASLATQEVSLLKRAAKYDEAVKRAREHAVKYPDSKLELMNDEIDCLIRAGKKAEARKRLKEFEAAASKAGGRRVLYYQRKVERLRRKLNGGGIEPGRGDRRRRRR